MAEEGSEGEIGSEVYLSGGIAHAASGEINSVALFLPSVKGLSIFASGPRVTPPSVSSDDRDSTQSLALDAKQGDMIFNTTTDRPEVRIGASWQQIPSRAASAEFVDDTSMSTPEDLISDGVAGFYRISVYLEKVTSGAGTVQADVTWTDDATQRTRSVSVTDSGANVLASDEFPIYLAAGESIAYQILTPQSHQARVRLQVEVA